MRRIISVTVHRETDDNPDTSWIGEYTDQGDDWNIERATGEYVCQLPEDHFFRESGREYRFFKPYAGGEKKGTKEYQEYGKQDFERMESLAQGNWGFMGIYVTAKVVLTSSNVTHTIRSGGLWGIESDSEGSYLSSIEEEEITSLREELLSVGFSAEEIEKAIEERKAQ